MATKRKREKSDDSILSPPTKLIRDEDVTRSGRVRKKPSKFVEDEKGVDAKSGTHTEQVLIPLSVQEMFEEQEQHSLSISEEMNSPSKGELSLSADEDQMKSGGGRAGRARKKSAKVLEMEEFEEAEKKSMKKDAGKKGATSASNLLKKTPKSPTSPSIIMTSPQSATKIKITNTPSFSSPVITQISPIKKNTSPKSPIVLAPQLTTGEGNASMIKLLLSTPAQTPSSMIATSSVSPISPTLDKPEVLTKKKGKNKEKPTEEIIVKSQTGSMAQLKKVLQLPKQSLVVKAEPETLDDIDISLNTVVKSEQIETPIKVEKVKLAKDVKAKKVKKSPKESPIMSPSTLPSPNVIHVGSMNLSGIDVKPELEIVSSSKKKKLSKVKIEREEEAMISDEYELNVPDIELGEPGEDSFMKMDEDSLEIPTEEFEMRTKSFKKRKPVKEKGEKHSASDAMMEMQSSELVMDFSKMKSNDKKKKKQSKEALEDLEKSKKKRAPTAYTLWCNTHRPKVVADNPGIDFSSISKTLGEMWSSLPEKEKMMWKRKAKKAAGKGSTLITTGKTGSAKGPVPQIIPVSKPSKESLQKVTIVQSAPVPVAKQQKIHVILDDVNAPLKAFGKEPVDVAAHLKIVGESLSIIGMKLQEHRGLIAVQGSLSVLLDSMLCAVAPLMCLTAILPETDGLPDHVHMKNLDNIAYIMPGL